MCSSTVLSEKKKTKIGQQVQQKEQILNRFMYMCSHTKQIPQANLMLQVARQLEKARAEVSNAEAASSGHASALSDKERQKKWMKF